MAMHPCPHCGGPGISTFRKYRLGPASPASCQTCGRQIGVPWSSLLTMIPFGLVLLLRPYLPEALFVIALGASVALMIFLWRRVPLVKR